MLDNRTFWIALMAAIVLLVHVLELPLAFRALRDRNPSRRRVIAATLAFGAAWWLPARRGLFKAG